MNDCSLNLARVRCVKIYAQRSARTQIDQTYETFRKREANAKQSRLTITCPVINAVGNTSMSRAAADSSSLMLNVKLADCRVARVDVSGKQTSLCFRRTTLMDDRRPPVFDILAHTTHANTCVACAIVRISAINWPLARVASSNVVLFHRCLFRVSIKAIVNGIFPARDCSPNFADAISRRKDIVES